MKIHNTCADRFISPTIGETVLHGVIGELAERMFFRRINSPEARNTVYQETIDAFRNKLDLTVSGASADVRLCTASYLTPAN